MMLAGILFVALQSIPFFARAETAEDLKRVEQKLLQQKAEAERLAKQEKDTTKELSSLQKELVQATQALEIKQNEQNALKDRLRALENDITKREEDLSGAQVKLGSMAEALLRFSRQPPEVYLLKGPLTEDTWRRALLLRALLPRLERETIVLSRELKELEKLRRDAAEKKRRVASAQQQLNAQRSDLDGLVKTRQQFLNVTTAEKSALAKEMEALAEEAKDLRQLMEKVALRAPVPKNIKPPPLARDLKTPVNGTLVRSYGAKDEFGVTNQGVTMRATGGSLVVAPQAGRVAFAGPFQGYGQIVILQHVQGYHSFLAGFGRIDTNVGQSVAAGEPLGVMPDDGKVPQELYFEWRHKGEPVNPSTWKAE